MDLPANFQYSQSSLQDFVDCRRRFQLRYIQRLAWPAIESAPALENERFMQQGARFHRMIQQNQLGVPTERLTSMQMESDLERWWRSYLNNVEPASLAGLETIAASYAEITLSAPLDEKNNLAYRLAAKYDLILLSKQGRAAIIDWKTSRRRPPRPWLAKRMQTRVYPYLLCRAGADLNQGQVIQPEAVEMIYWFADYPDEPERFTYSARRYKADEKELLGLGNIIQGLPPEGFPLTTDERRCAFCVYRSLCNRGVAAGDLSEMPAGAETEDAAGFTLDMDFEQIAEIEY